MISRRNRKKLMRFRILLWVVALADCNLPFAQRIDALSAEVRKYVRVSTPRVILEHVQIIDGTGAAPSADQNITIADGKIAAITAGADQPASDGTTIINLRGYS